MLVFSIDEAEWCAAMRVEMVQRAQLGNRGPRFSATTAANGYAGLSLLSAQLPSNYLPQSMLPSSTPSPLPLIPAAEGSAWPFSSQSSGVPSLMGSPMMPYGPMPIANSASTAFPPYVPPGYVPILAPVSLLQQLSEPSVDNFDRQATDPVSSSHSLRHDKGDSASFSTARSVSDEKQAPESSSDAEEDEGSPELRRHKRSEPLFRRARRWAGAGLVVAATITSALAGVSFGWRRQQFLVPSVLKRLPMFAQRSLSTMNAGVLAGGIGYLISDALRGTVGLNPRRLHYHTIDTELDGTY